MIEDFEGMIEDFENYMAMVMQIYNLKKREWK